MRRLPLGGGGGLPSLLEGIERLDARYELIFLCHRHLSSYRKTPSHQCAGGHNLHLVYGNFCSTAGYVISRTAIEKLLPRMLTMRKPTDHFMSMAYIQGVAAYIVLPRPIKAEEEPSINNLGPAGQPYRPEGSVSASLDRALCLLLKKARWLVELGFLGFRAYRLSRKLLYLLRISLQERRNSSRAVNDC